MRTGDSPKREIAGTAGLSSANQLVTVTSIPIASGRMDLTARPEPFVVGVRRVSEPRKSFVTSETMWKQLAIRERKTAKRRGFKPSDVVKAVAASRYRR
jgi:hypothetical protein